MSAADRTPPKNAPLQIATASASRATRTCRMVLSAAMRVISGATQSSGSDAASVTPAFLSCSWILSLTSMTRVPLPSIVGSAEPIKPDSPIESALRCGTRGNTFGGRRVTGGRHMKIPRRRFLHLACGAAAAPALPRVAWAQSYPARPIRLVIPYPPGGVYDGTGRPFAEKVKTHLGTIVIENIGGGGSSLGTLAVARAQPDGYTLLLAGNSGLVINPIASTRTPYDPVNDFEPIAILGRNPTAIDVHPAQPIHTLNELVDYAK